MTFKTDAQSDIAIIIDDTDEFGVACSYIPSIDSLDTPITFNALLGEGILHGDDDRGGTELDDVRITVTTADVASVKYRGIITINSINYEVVNDPFTDSIFSGTSVIDLRRVNDTKI